MTTELRTWIESQGSAEKRSEMYSQYIERASQAITQRFAKSISRVGSFAGKQADAVHKSK